MNTYIAWNDKIYSWPPPEGWQKASDGKWWAPGTGPDIPGYRTDVALAYSNTDQSLTISTAENSIYSSLSEESLANNYVDPTLSWQQNLSPELTPTATATMTLQQPSDTVTTAEDTQIDDWDLIMSDTSELEIRRRNQVITAAIAGATLLLLIVLIVILNAEDKPQSAQPLSQATIGAPIGAYAPAAVSTSEIAKPVAPIQKEADLEKEPDQAANKEPNQEALVKTYREMLSNKEITSDQLGDADLVLFADTSCIYASTAQSNEEYKAARNGLIAQISNNQLSDSELAFAIDGAVTVFCPNHAERVNVQAQ